MKYIKNFEKYRTKIIKIEQLKYNESVLLLNNVDLSSNDEQLFKNIFEKVLSTSKIEESIKNEIRNYVSESNLLTEGFFDKLKERFPKAAQVSKVLSDKAEQSLGKIINSVKDAVSFVKKIGSGIKEFFLSVVEKGKAFFT